MNTMTFAPPVPVRRQEASSERERPAQRAARFDPEALPYFAQLYSTALRMTPASR